MINLSRCDQDIQRWARELEDQLEKAKNDLLQEAREMHDKDWVSRKV